MKDTKYFKKIKYLISLGRPNDAIMRGSATRSRYYKDIDFEQSFPDRKNFFNLLINFIDKINEEKLINFLEYKINDIKYKSLEDILDDAENIMKYVMDKNVKYSKIDLLCYFPFGMIPKGYRREYMEITNVYVFDDLKLEKKIKDEKNEKLKKLLKEKDYYGIIKFFRVIAISKKNQDDIKYLEGQLDKVKELSLKLTLTPYDVNLKRKLDNDSLKIIKDIYKHYTK